MRDAIQDSHNEKQHSQSCFTDSESFIKPIGQQCISEKSTASGIQSEKCCNLANGSPRCLTYYLCCSAAFRCRNFHLRIKKQIKQRTNKIDRGIEKEKRTVCFEQRNMNPLPN